MEDKKLIAAIIGAITAYIQMEQQPPSVTPGSKPQPKIEGWKVSKQQKLMKGQKA